SISPVVVPVSITAGPHGEYLEDRGVDSSIFQNPKKLHLTIGMLVLLSEQEIQQTCEMLQRCKEEFINDISGGKPLEVEMAGIEYMNDDPGMVDVLYAKVHMKDGSNRLQELVDRVLERFQASGLTVKEWNSVKLHATVMNTLFRKDPNAEGRYNLYTADGKYIFKERESFDGRNILKVSMKQNELEILRHGVLHKRGKQVVLLLTVEYIFFHAFHEDH
ncbi:Hypothetical predicted protein, partial [Marmota monax]